MTFKYACVLYGVLLFGCQSGIKQIGQEHAEEVLKWQELARYAGNELKYLGLTVTAGVQVNQGLEGTTYSIVKVQLNQNADHREIDLLSPEFAEKFACGTDCQKLGLYDSNFVEQKTQLTSFFFSEEGRFFEFYGRLTRLNETLAFYRASSPDILDKYLTLMLNRKLVFDSLAEFIDDLETHISEDKLLAFSRNGFISPIEDRLSPTFLDDVIVSLPKVHGNEVTMPEDNWNNNALTADELFYDRLLAKTASASNIDENWKQAKQHTLQVGSIACSYSDNSFGVVKLLQANQVTLQVIAQARILVDGMKLYPQPGYLFTAAESFYFVEGTPNETYPASDVATCNIENLKRGQA
jgi:hypothetical protein